MKPQSNRDSRPKLEQIDSPVEAVELEGMRAADVIISITSAFEPLLMDAHVKGPTHIAAMGTDTRGKQELDPALVRRARLFTDEVAQSLSIGEFQHAAAQNMISTSDVTAIGQVIIGNHRGSSAIISDHQQSGLACRLPDEGKLLVPKCRS